MLNLALHHSDGYDVCYVTIPGRSLDDAQVNAEYVAYNIQDLAGKSANGKVYVVGHSQGVSLSVTSAITLSR